MFLQLCLSDFVTVFAARTRQFFERRPGIALCSSSRPSSTATAASFGGMKPIHPRTAVFIWIYVIILFVVQDAAEKAAWTTQRTSISSRPNPKPRCRPIRAAPSRKTCAAALVEGLLSTPAGLGDIFNPLRRLTGYTPVTESKRRANRLSI